MSVPMWIWIAATVIFFAAEAITTELVSIWFAVSALVALLAAAFGAPVWLQAALFIICAATLLILTRPLVRRITGGRRTPTNADRVIGETAIVTEAIDGATGRGQVTVLGQVWSARAAGTDIPAGASVTVLAIEGVKLAVELKEEKAWAQQDTSLAE